VAYRAALEPTVEVLRDAGIRVSLFIDPDSDQVTAASELGASVVEFHTGAFAEAVGEARSTQLMRLVDAATLAVSAGIQVNAGHGLNYDNINPILELPGIVELNIGHAIVSRALFVGMEQAVREMIERFYRKK